MTKQPFGQPEPPDVRDVMKALRRAAYRAHEEAIRTGTRLVIVRDGKIEHITPSDLKNGNAQ